MSTVEAVKAAVEAACARDGLSQEAFAARADMLGPALNRALMTGTPGHRKGMNSTTVDKLARAAGCQVVLVPLALVPNVEQLIAEHGKKGRKA